ncbi:MAG: hypothetical protein A2289_08180 [Deltaproteobacteria bacterium RIFOXYA12_FULL_58_15]|nr:MAG: hypothetical protein A2289_08180 [Deltaproteobacteria bacterium RIFOXYA12_FULL_58_15]
MPQALASLSLEAYFLVRQSVWKPSGAFGWRHNRLPIKQQQTHFRWQRAGGPEHCEAEAANVMLFLEQKTTEAESSEQCSVATKRCPENRHVRGEDSPRRIEFRGSVVTD